MRWPPPDRHGSSRTIDRLVPGVPPRAAPGDQGDPAPVGENHSANHRVDTLLETLGGFAEVLTHGFEVPDVLHDLTERMTAVLGLTGAGVSLLHGERIAFATADSDGLANLERIQEKQ